MKDDRGRVVAGARLAVQRFVGLRASGAPVRTTTVRTDERGAFSFLSERPLETTTVRLAATGRVAGRRTVVLPARGPLPDSLTLWVTRLDREVFGTVRGPGGVPASDVVVRWGRHARTRTDAEGRYRLRIGAGLPHLALWSPGHVTAEPSVRDVRAGQSVRIDVRLATGRRVTGLVRDTARVPIAGTRVYLRHDRSRGVTTGEDGLFAIDWLDPQRSASWLDLRHDRYQGSMWQVGNGGARGVKFALRPGAGAHGRVLDAAGQPVAGAAVFVPWPAVDPDAPRAVTDANGEFRVAGIEPGLWTIVVKRWGFATLTKMILAEPPQEAELELRMSAQLAFLGHITGPGGGRIAGAQVRLEAKGADFTPRIDLACEAWTDDSGAFRIPDAPAKGASVVIEVPGYERVRQPVRRGMSVRLTPAAFLAGTVRDGETRSQVPLLAIRSVQPTLAPGERAGKAFRGLREIRDPGGAWRVSLDAVPGARDLVFAIAVDVPGRGRVVLDRLRPGAAPRTATVRGGATLTGTVRGGRAPLAGADVRLFAMCGRKTALQTLAEAESRRVRTDPGGRYRFDDVPEGELWLVVDRRGRPRKIDGPFTLGRGGSHTRDVALDVLATVVLVLPEGAPARARGFLDPLSGRVRSRRTERQRPQGVVTFGRVRAGKYLLGWGHGNASVGRVIEVTGSSSERIEVDPKEGTTTLTGTLRCSTPVPPRVRVELLPLEATRLRRSTRAEHGRFRFTGLARGRYRIRCNEWVPAKDLVFEGRLVCDLTDENVDVVVDVVAAPTDAEKKR